MRALLSPIGGDHESVIYMCLRMVAKAEDVHQTTPGLSLHEVAIIAQSVLEVIDAPDLETVTSGSDWLLAVAAGVARATAPEGEAWYAPDVLGRIATLYEAIAASAHRSPLVNYQEIYNEVALERARRGDREGAVLRLREGMAEALHDRDDEGVEIALADLAEVNLDFGDVDACLDLFAGLMQARPTRMFNYWHLASTLRSRVPSIGVLAAKRGLELAAHRGKPPGFDLRKLIDEGERGVDTMEPSPRAASALREALRRDFDVPREGLVETAHRLVPELATTRVKELPPMPEPAELVVIGRRLRPVVDELERRETLLAAARSVRRRARERPN